MQVESVNGHSPEEKLRPTTFDDLTSPPPEQTYVCWKRRATRRRLASVDLFTPIGKGQRGLIVSPAYRQNGDAAKVGLSDQKEPP
jgi:transcription termination factor Rho